MFDPAQTGKEAPARPDRDDHRDCATSASESLTRHLNEVDRIQDGGYLDG
jgi:hypothetical protein